MPSDLLQVECNYNEKIYLSCNCGNEIYQPIEKNFENNFASIKLWWTNWNTSIFYPRIGGIILVWFKI
jgi:hypothetical protein